MRHEEYMKQAMAQSDVGNIEDYPPSADIDMVNNPPHYNQTGIECIDAISAATGDGYKYYLDEVNWVMIRPSGTEAVVRIYSEGESSDKSEYLQGLGKKIMDGIMR